MSAATDTTPESAEREAAIDRLIAKESELSRLADQAGALLTRLGRDGIINDLVNATWLLLADDGRVEEPYLHGLTPKERYALLLKKLVRRLPDDVRVVMPHEAPVVPGLVDLTKLDTEQDRHYGAEINRHLSAVAEGHMSQLKGVPRAFLKVHAPQFAPELSYSEQAQLDDARRAVQAGGSPLDKEAAQALIDQHERGEWPPNPGGAAPVDDADDGAVG